MWLTRAFRFRKIVRLGAVRRGCASRGRACRSGSVWLCATSLMDSGLFGISYAFWREKQQVRFYMYAGNIKLVAHFCQEGARAAVPVRSACSPGRFRAGVHSPSAGSERKCMLLLAICQQVRSSWLLGECTPARGGEGRRGERPLPPRTAPPATPTSPAPPHHPAIVAAWSRGRPSQRPCRRMCAANDRRTPWRFHERTSRASPTTRG